MIGPLRNVYGVSDKVLAMALSSLLLGAGNQRPLWFEVGATFVAVDTLVHNFLHRTGILRRLSAAEHPYGDSAAIGPAGALTFWLGPRHQASMPANSIRPSPRRFRGSFRVRSGATAPRTASDICNGNRIADDRRCDNGHCQLFRRCDRVALHERKKSS